MDMLEILQSVIDKNCNNSSYSDAEYDIYHVISYQESLLHEICEVLDLNTCTREMILEYLQHEVDTDIADLKVVVGLFVEALESGKLIQNVKAVVIEHKKDKQLYE